jgi:nucleotide-binding universal stress UspA family protein
MAIDGTHVDKERANGGHADTYDDPGSMLATRSPGGWGAAATGMSRRRLSRRHHAADPGLRRVVTSVAGRSKRITKEVAVMSTSPGTGTEPIFRIVHPTDFSTASEVAFLHALRLALATHAELSLLHATTEQRGPDWSAFPGVRDTLHRWGRDGDAGAPAREPALRVGKFVAVDGDPVHAAVEFVQGHPTELVVLATEQRRGVARWTHRATAEPLARGTGAMTLFIPARSEGFVASASGQLTLDRILVPVDHTPKPEAATDAVEALVTGLGATGACGRILHVGEAGAMPALRFPVPAACQWEIVARPGNPVDEIVAAAAAWAADLIVMTTAGHAGVLDALRGSTTERVLRLTRCPVLAVPSGSRAMRQLFGSRQG